MDENILLDVRNLAKHFPVYGGIFRRVVAYVKAVDDVTFGIKTGETLAVVGESGSGKTTLAKTVLRIYEPTAGRIFFDAPLEIRRNVSERGTLSEKIAEHYDLARIRGRRLKSIRRRMQMVYQDPASSLNPRMLVKDIIAEPIRIHGLKIDVDTRVSELLTRVGMSEEHMYRYPHELSGGQRQRVAIARALSTDPDFVVLDEPTSSVDVSVRVQILNLLRELQSRMELTYMFITHDLNVVDYIANRVMVMYLGKVMEMGERTLIFKKPGHPYTEALLSAIPIADPFTKRKRIILKGEVPSPIHPPNGCPFSTRCPYARERCFKEPPPLDELREGQLVTCFYPLS
ncbi:MAG: ATP-binding cassette domain-containing protein [Nitrososphaerota archaeon]